MVAQFRVAYLFDLIPTLRLDKRTMSSGPASARSGPVASVILKTTVGEIANCTNYMDNGLLPRLKLGTLHGST